MLRITVPEFGLIQLGIATVHLKVGVLFTLAKSRLQDCQQLEAGEASSLSLSPPLLCEIGAEGRPMAMPLLYTKSDSRASDRVGRECMLLGWVQ